MEESLVFRVSETEQFNNSKLLERFSIAFSANDPKSIREMLHPDGVFFGKYNNIKAAGCFYSIFFGEKGISELHHMTIRTGFTLDHLAGEVVLEFRSSNFDPFVDNSEDYSPRFGDKAYMSYEEVVYQFAFGFSGNKIISIRKPLKSISKEIMMEMLN